MAVKGAIKLAFLSAVLLSFAGDMLFVNCSFSNYEEKFDDIMLKNLHDWIPLVGLALKHGIPKSHQTLNEYLQGLPNKASSDIFDQLWKKYKDYLNKWLAKDAIQSILTKLMPRLIERFGVKIAGEILLKTASHPVGYVADVAQILLEICGYEMAGKIVGAAGNSLGGVLAGFSVAGPPGAILGGVLGLGVWAIGEYIHYEHIQQLESFVERIVKN